MKPFNLEEAKAGKPVCTRDGRDVRIMCWDCKGDMPIVALLDLGFDEYAGYYNKNGRNRRDEADSRYDLFMKSTIQKRFCLFSNLFGDIYNGQSFSSLEDAQYKLRSLENSIHQSGVKYQIIEFEVEV